MIAYFRMSSRITLFLFVALPLVIGEKLPFHNIKNKEVLLGKCQNGELYLRNHSQVGFRCNENSLQFEGCFPKLNETECVLNGQLWSDNSIEGTQYQCTEESFVVKGCFRNGKLTEVGRAISVNNITLQAREVWDHSLCKFKCALLPPDDHPLCDNNTDSSATTTTTKTSTSLSEGTPIDSKTTTPTVDKTDLTKFTTTTTQTLKTPAPPSRGEEKLSQGAVCVPEGICYRSDGTYFYSNGTEGTLPEVEPFKIIPLGSFRVPWTGASVFPSLKFSFPGWPWGIFGIKLPDVTFGDGFDLSSVGGIGIPFPSIFLPGEGIQLSKRFGSKIWFINGTNSPYNEDGTIIETTTKTTIPTRSFTSANTTLRTTIPTKNTTLSETTTVHTTEPTTTTFTTEAPTTSTTEQDTTTVTTTTEVPSTTTQCGQTTPKDCKTEFEDKFDGCKFLAPICMSSVISAAKRKMKEVANIKEISRWTVGMENITTARDLAKFVLQNSVNVIGLETKPTNPAEHVLQREVGRIFGLKYASLDLDHVKETCKQDILGCARLSAKSCWSLSEKAECLSEKLENDGSCDSCSGRDGPTVQLVQLLCPATCGVTEFDEKASPVAIARRMKKALFCSAKREPSKEKISDTFDEYYASLEEEGKDNNNKQRGNDGYQENDITKQLR